MKLHSKASKFAIFYCLCINAINYFVIFRFMIRFPIEEYIPKLNSGSFEIPITELGYSIFVTEIYSILTRKFYILLITEFFTKFDHLSLVFLGKPADQNRIVFLNWVDQTYAK